LPSDRRLAAIAALALFLTLFLPWYQQSVIARSAAAKNLQAASTSITGWGAFSFVEAAVLVVAVSVLVLLFQRAEGKAFHLPGGDGWVITAAGAWTCFLVIWRMFDKQGTTNRGQYALTAGIEWGIFVALFVAAWLTWAGTRIRAAHQPEPPLPGADGIVFDGHWHAAGEREDRASRRRRSEARGRNGGDRRDRAREAASADRAAQRSAERSPDRPSAAAPGGRRAGPRSSWSPAERPEWSESEHPTGWLGAPPPSEPSESSPAEPPAGRPEPPPGGPASDQLAIPLDGDE
jgi:hypothetical protein